MDIDEPVDVELSPDGAPVRFTWRGVHYGVISAPEPWLGRRSWWQTDARAPRGGGTTIERELWRVDAVPLQGVHRRLDGSFDLARGASGCWQLERAWDDELDERLIA